MAERIYHLLPAYKAKLCVHCGKGRMHSKRGLCQTCNKTPGLREKYRDHAYGICRSCRKWKRLRPRDLCWRCYYEPETRQQFPSVSKYRPKIDDNRPRLPVLERYPDHAAQVLCPCGLSWDGACVHCERVQRAGMVMVEEEDNDRGYMAVE